MSIGSWIPGLGLTVQRIPYLDIVFGPGAGQCVVGSLVPGPYPIDTTGATSGQSLTFNGTKFVPGALSSGLTIGYTLYLNWNDNGGNPNGFITFGGNVGSTFDVGNNGFATRLRGSTTTVTNLTQFGALSTDSSGTPGNATINKPSGRSAIAASASSCVITNSGVGPGDHVFIQLETADGTLTRAIAVAGTGSFTVTGNSNATGNTTFSWFVVKAN